MKRFRWFAICLLFLLLITHLNSYAQKYVLVWNDEFNTPGLPDSTRWNYEVGQLRNNEQQYYTSKRLENARIEDSVLILEARKESFAGANYTSASIISRGIGDWKYGKVEIRAKVPTGKGTWPALWMMPTNSEYGGWPRSGEIDIMEYIGVEAQKLYYTCHFEGTNGSGHQSSGGNSTFISNPYNQFIKFTLVWTPEKIEWYANDRKFHQYVKPAGDYRSWPFDKEFYLILNLAYGGNWGGYAGVDDTKLPHKFLIDYVRVYQLQDTDSPFKLDIIPTKHGKGEITPKLDSYLENTEVTLTALPDSGYSFKAWQYMSGANPYTFKIGKNTTVTPVFYNPGELLSNGEFDKSWSPWNFYVYDNQLISYKPSIDDSIFVVNITKTTGTDWHVGFQENGLSMKKANYKLTFDAWADQQKQLTVTVARNYGDWGSYLNKSVNITTAGKRYEVILNMPVADENVRLYFGIGRFLGKFYIDNISLTQIEPATANQGTKFEENTFDVFPNPAEGSLTVHFSDFDRYKNTEIRLLAADGRLVNRSIMSGTPTTINTSGLKPGIYFVQLVNNNKSFSKKVIIH